MPFKCYRYFHFGHTIYTKNVLILHSNLYGCMNRAFVMQGLQHSPPMFLFGTTKFVFTGSPKGGKFNVNEWKKFTWSEIFSLVHVEFPAFWGSIQNKFSCAKQTYRWWVLTTYVFVWRKIIRFFWVPKRREIQPERMKKVTSSKKVWLA